MEKSGLPYAGPQITGGNHFPVAFYEIARKLVLEPPNRFAAHVSFEPPPRRLVEIANRASSMIGSFSAIGKQPVDHKGRNGSLLGSGHGVFT